MFQFGVRIGRRRMHRSSLQELNTTAPGGHRVRRRRSPLTLFVSEEFREPIFGTRHSEGPRGSSLGTLALQNDATRRRLDPAERLLDLRKVAA